MTSSSRGANASALNDTTCETVSKVRSHGPTRRVGGGRSNVSGRYLHKQAQAAWNGISIEQLLEELRQVQQFVLLYPPQGDKVPNRGATVLSKQTLTQQALAKTLGLDQLHITQRG